MNKQTKKAPLWLKIVGVAVAGLAFAPIAFYTIVGLLGLAVTIVLVLSGIFLGPVLAEKLANWKMLGLTSEWAKNPIPTLQRQYAEKVEKLNESLKALEIFIGKVRSYETQVRNYKSNFPQNKEKHALYQKQYEQFFSLQQLKQKKFKEAQEAVEKFGQTVVEAEAEWNMALAARDVDLAADFNNDPMELLKARTALTAVEDAMNQSLAQLDIALLEEPKWDGNVYENIPSIASSSGPIPLQIPAKKETTR